MAGSPRINPFWYSSICANSTIACEVSRFLAMSASRVRPIRTEQDYTRALARIEALMFQFEMILLMFLRHSSKSYQPHPIQPLWSFLLSPSHFKPP